MRTAAWTAACAAALTTLTPDPSGAQFEKSATVEGRVMLAQGEAKRPSGGVWVALHRVGRDSAGVVDSVRTGADGRYRIRYRPAADARVAYFVSTEYAGIAYFSERLQAVGAERVPAQAELTVYDTTSHPLPIDIASRHIVVSAADTGPDREVTEVYIVSNAGNVTRVAGEGITFEAGLPLAARDPRAGEGDVAAEAIRFAGGKVLVDAPLPPGTKRFSVSYRIAATEAAVTFAVPRASDVVEVLVGDSLATVSGAGVHEEAPVVLGNLPYRRFVAHGVPAASVVTVTLPAGNTHGADGRRLVVIVVSAVMMLALALALARRRSGARAELAPGDRAQ